jgi:hypothetical protein
VILHDEFEHREIDLALAEVGADAAVGVEDQPRLGEEALLGPLAPQAGEAHGRAHDHEPARQGRLQPFRELAVGVPHLVVVVDEVLLGVPARRLEGLRPHGRDHHAAKILVPCEVAQHGGAPGRSDPELRHLVAGKPLAQDRGLDVEHDPRIAQQGDHLLAVHAVALGGPAVLAIGDGRQIALCPPEGFEPTREGDEQDGREDRDPKAVHRAAARTGSR